MSFAEAAIVVGQAGAITLTHVPAGRTAVAIPDAPDLWEHLIEHRDTTVAVAHLHPGAGVPSASREDLTTFDAIERGLGRRLQWWIATSDAVARFSWDERAGRYFRAETMKNAPAAEPTWVPYLRSLGHDTTKGAST